jgi:general secretion pathway protein D
MNSTVWRRILGRSCREPFRVRALCTSALILLGVGCAQWPHYPREPLPAIKHSTTQPSSDTGVVVEPAFSPSGAVKKPIKIYPTDNPNARLSTALGVGTDGKGQVVLNFEEADLRDVATVILGETLKVNYAIDPAVTGKISIKSPRGFNNDDLLPLLESMLAANNAALVREPTGLFRVLPRDKLKGTGSPPLAPNVNSATAAGYQTRIVPLQFIAVAELEKLIKPLLSEQVSMQLDTRRNLVMLLGSATEIDKLLQTVALFDVDWLAGMSVGLFPITYAKATDIAGELNTVFGQGGEQANSGGVTVTDGIVRFLAIERLNAILAVTPQPKYLERVEAWIARLDQAEDSEARRLFVYRVENGKATSLAGVLNQLFQDTAYPGVFPPVATVAPGSQPIELSAPATESSISTGIATPSPFVPQSFSPGFVGSASGVRIIADEINNALVIMATAREYAMLREALKQLDLVPLQVFVEANVVEVSLTDDLNYGVEWFFKNNFADDKGGRGLLDLGSAGLNPLVPGFSYAVVDAANRVRAIINALAAQTDVNVLSSPTLMVLNNQKATINVGDEVPVPTRQSVSNINPDAPTVNEIEYRNTGVILEVTPRVNHSGLVTMDVVQEVSDVGPPTTAGIAAPTFQQRKVKSTIAISSGNTVILGGLIRDRASIGESGLPFLGRLPLLGKLFSATTQAAARTELLVMITPRVLDDAAQAAVVAEEYREKLSRLRDPGKSPTVVP